MGINMHVYTVYGVKLPWNDAFYEAYEEIEEALLDEFGWGKPQPADRQIEVIMDAMMGEYMVLGTRLYDSGDFRYCDDMNNYQEISIDGLHVDWLDYKEKFARLYPNHVHLLEGIEPKMINLIHYS
jgi:hypothetical protein